VLRSGFGLDELLGRSGEDAGQLSHADATAADSRDTTARAGRAHLGPGLTERAEPERPALERRTRIESVRRDARSGAKSAGSRNSSRGVALASRPSAQNMACSNAA
jgi:hypothetical protein